MSRSHLVDFREALLSNRCAARISIRRLRDVEQTTPSAPIRNGSIFLMARPPLLSFARFDRDVLGHAGVQWLMLFEGTNDVGGLARDPQSMTAADLIGAYQQMIERAHAHGIKVAGCTLNPFQGMTYYTEQSEAT